MHNNSISESNNNNDISSECIIKSFRFNNIDSDSDSDIVIDNDCDSDSYSDSDSVTLQR